jgi:hypothetical protein
LNFASIFRRERGYWQKQPTPVLKSVKPCLGRPGRAGIDIK